MAEESKHVQIPPLPSADGEDGDNFFATLIEAAKGKKPEFAASAKAITDYAAKIEARVGKDTLKAEGSGTALAREAMRLGLGLEGAPSGEELQAAIDARAAKDKKDKDLVVMQAAEEGLRQINNLDKIDLAKLKRPATDKTDDKTKPADEAQLADMGGLLLPIMMMIFKAMGVEVPPELQSMMGAPAAAPATTPAPAATTAPTTPAAATAFMQNPAPAPAPAAAAPQGPGQFLTGTTPAARPAPAAAPAPAAPAPARENRPG